MTSLYNFSFHVFQNFCHEILGSLFFKNSYLQFGTENLAETPFRTGHYSKVPLEKIVSHYLWWKFQNGEPKFFLNFLNYSEVSWNFVMKFWYLKELCLNNMWLKFRVHENFTLWVISIAILWRIIIIIIKKIKPAKTI